jgi:hypothetical protein
VELAFLMYTPPKQLFPTGRLFVTDGAKNACSNERLAACFKQHVQGDWGLLDAEDKEHNARALETGARLFSSYAIDPDKPCKGWGDNCLWIITEGRTTANLQTLFLLPDEY